MVESALVRELRDRIRRLTSILKSRGDSAILAFSSYLEREGNVYYVSFS